MSVLLFPRTSLRLFKNIKSRCIVLCCFFVFGCGLADLDVFFSQDKSQNCGVHSLLTVIPDSIRDPFSLEPLSLNCSARGATTLFVSEWWSQFSDGNNRLLVFDISSITNGENAVNVLGQADFTSKSRATSQTGINGPGYLQSNLVSQYLYLPDLHNNRVLIWDVSSITDGENAAYVLGQSNFTSSSSGTTSSTMKDPVHVDIDSSGNRLFVVDLSNRRVLVFDVSTITNGQVAQNVLGQADFTSSGAGTTQSSLNNPTGISYDSTNQRLFVADGANHRVVVFNVSSITNGENAVNVLGQSNFTSGSANQGGSASQATLSSPNSIAYDTSYLYVADTDNSRVVIFDVSTISDGENAAYVLGQPDFTTTSSGTTAAKMNGAEGVVIDSVGKKLFVADRGNNRVLIFDINSISNGESAVNVLGQVDFTSSTEALTQGGMDYPIGVALK